MVSGAQNTFLACVRSIRREDVYYADFGSVKDAVGYEEVTYLEVMLTNIDAEKHVQAFQDSVKMSDERIKEVNKITFVKELMDEAV